MPPAPHEYIGIDAIRAFLRASFGFRGERAVGLLPASANTQPALGSYLAAGATAEPAGLLVLTMRGDRIRGMTRFHLGELYPRFGLPRETVLAQPPPSQTGLAWVTD